MPKVSSLNSFSIESWNCSRWNAIKGSAVMNNFANIDIVGLTEMHLKDSNAILSGHILKSGGDDKDPAAGVGFMLSPRAQKALIFANAISPRIMMARFKADHANLTVIVAYIPHQGRDQSPTYIELENIINSVSKHDCLVVIGDFNSRLARSDINNDFLDKELVGRWSIHHKDCPGGKLLRGLLHRQNLCAVSTMFQPKRNRTNATWINPCTNLKPSQIDHILVCNRWKSWVSSCRVRWGPSRLSYGYKYDHGTVKANFKVKTRAFNTNRTFNVRLLSDPVYRESYQRQLKTKLTEDVSIPLDTNGRWLRLKQAAYESATQCLKPIANPIRKKGYMSANTLNLLEERVKSFENMNGSIPSETKKAYSKKVSQSLRKDYKNFVENTVLEMEAADSVHNVKKVHQLKGILTGKWKRGNTTLTKDKDGKPLTNESDRMATFKDFFEIKFSSAPKLSEEIEPIPIEVPNSIQPEIYESPPSLEEVEMAVKHLSNGKSPGIDSIPIELIKNSPEAINELHLVIKDIWENHSIPSDWSQGLFVNIYKGKGSKNDPANYRPICLLSHAYKAFGIILLERMRVTIDIRIKEGQEGFRNGRGCRDNLHVLRAAINFALKNAVETEITFIDFTQAFDTVSHEFLQIALIEHGIPEKFRKIIGAIYNSAEGRIKGASGITSDPFQINRGVLQGDILSPILFILTLNSIWNRSNKEEGWRILPGWILDELSYADDIAMISKGKESSAKRLQEFSDLASKTASMRINIAKTVRMQIEPLSEVTKTTEEDIKNLNLQYSCDVCERKFPTVRGVSIHKTRWCKGPGTAGERSRTGQKADKLVKNQKREQELAKKEKISLNGIDLVNVSTFKYLGAYIAAWGSDEEDVEARITRNALSAHRSLNSFWKDKRISLEMKIRLFKICVISILTYGAESWLVTKRMMQNIRGFVMRCFGSMVPPTNTNRLSNQQSKRAIYKKRFDEAMRHIDIISIIDKKRWQWLGHALRMSPTRNPHKALMLLDFSTKGSLLSHIPIQYRQLDSLQLAIEVASDRNKWKEIYENRNRGSGFISLGMLYPTK